MNANKCVGVGANKRLFKIQLQKKKKKKEYNMHCNTDTRVQCYNKKEKMAKS